MIDDVKEILSPTLSLIKELNNQIKNNQMEADTLIKLSTTMKVSSIKLDKLVKQNKLKINGGVEAKVFEDDDEVF
jgi:hypothetical protein